MDSLTLLSSQCNTALLVVMLVTRVPSYKSVHGDFKQLAIELFLKKYMCTSYEIARLDRYSLSTRRTCHWLTLFVWQTLRYHEAHVKYCQHFNVGATAKLTSRIHLLACSWRFASNNWRRARIYKKRGSWRHRLSGDPPYFGLTAVSAQTARKAGLGESGSREGDRKLQRLTHSMV